MTWFDAINACFEAGGAAMLSMNVTWAAMAIYYTRKNKKNAA